MQEIEAAVIERAGLPPTIETLLLDDPHPGEVLVRMTASGVCHSDLHVRDGEWERPGPIVMGHEGAGVVEAVGAGIDPGVIGPAGRAQLVRTLPPLPRVPARPPVGLHRVARRCTTPRPTARPAWPARTARRSSPTARSGRWPRPRSSPRRRSCPCPMGSRPRSRRSSAAARRRASGRCSRPRTCRRDRPSRSSASAASASRASWAP